LQEALTIADMVIAVLNGSRRTFEYCFQAFLSFEKGQPRQVLAVENRRSKTKYTRLVVRRSSVAAWISEKEGPIRTNRTQLTVEIRRLNGKRGNRLRRGLISIRPIQARSRQQPRLTSYKPRVDAISEHT
jgi:hypothetical protein